jgi:hypothetical protein
MRTKASFDTQSMSDDELSAVAGGDWFDPPSGGGSGGVDNLSQGFLDLGGGSCGLDGIQGVNPNTGGPACYWPDVQPQNGPAWSDESWGADY